MDLLERIFGSNWIADLSFPGHAGRPGMVGGSVPAKGGHSGGSRVAGETPMDAPHGRAAESSKSSETKIFSGRKLKDRTSKERSADRSALVAMGLKKLRSHQSTIVKQQTANYKDYMAEKDPTKRKHLEAAMENLDEMLKDVEYAIQRVAFKD